MTFRAPAAFAALIFSAVAALAAPAEGAADAARVAAQTVIERVAALPATSPAAVPEWNAARAGAPLLVHAPDAAPAYFIVPVADAAGRVVGVVTVGAADGAWRSYARRAPGAPPLPVDEPAARRALAARRGAAWDGAEALLTSGPDQRLYWTMKNAATGETAWIAADDASNVLAAAPRAVDVAVPANPPDAATIAAARAKRRATTSVEQRALPTSWNIADVPYHVQQTSYHCGPASLEMVMDYWGPDVAQAEVAKVANSKQWGSGAYAWWGTYADDNLRAANFSSISAAVQDATLVGYPERALGYAAAQDWWSYPADTPEYATRYDDLKRLVSSNLPVYILTWYDGTQQSGHFRVVKGYDDDAQTFIVHDPWYTAPYQGPDVAFAQTFLVDNLWTKYSRWGMVVAPWQVTIDAPATTDGCKTFTVTATARYIGPAPLSASAVPTQTQATLALPAGLSLAAGETATKTLTGLGAADTSAQASWSVQAACAATGGAVAVEAKGLIAAGTTSYPSYQDWVGGAATRDVVVRPDRDGDGYVDAEDCAPDNAAVHPGAAEVCDYADNDCDGTIDDGFATPGAVGALQIAAAKNQLAWAPEALAQHYEVVRGNLGALLAGSGAYGTAGTCLAADVAAAQATDATSPAPGGAAFYIVRGVRDCRRGTFDDGGGLSAPRDATLFTTPAACPAPQP